MSAQQTIFLEPACKHIVCPPVFGLRHGDLYDNIMNTQLNNNVIEVQDARHLSLEDFYNTIQANAKQKHDVVAPSTKMRSEGGIIVVGEDELVGTKHFHRQLANKLGIPQKYSEKMLAEAADLFDTNANHWFKQANKNFFVRAYNKAVDAESNINRMLGRAFLSDSYQVIDNLDIATIALDMVKQTGLACEVESCDLTETKMYMRLRFPELLVNSSALLKGYKTPDGNSDDERIAMSLIISNSEVGSGKLYIVPQVKMLVCSNGMTREQDIMGRTHLGAKMEQGTIKFSQRSKQLNEKLVISQMGDAIKQFLNIEYLEGRVAELEALNKPLEEPMEAIEKVAVKYGVTDAERNNIFNHFMKGGRSDKFAIAQATTWEAQQVDSAERQYDLESIASKIMATQLN